MCGGIRSFPTSCSRRAELDLHEVHVGEPEALRDRARRRGHLERVAVGVTVGVGQFAWTSAAISALESPVTSSRLW